MVCVILKTPILCFQFVVNLSYTWTTNLTVNDFSKT